MSFFVFVKPDAVAKNVAGQILALFEFAGFTVARVKTVTAGRALAEAHYAGHRGKAFYDGLVAFTASGPVVAAELRGDVAEARKLVGATDPAQAAENTIRRAFGTGVPNNAVHCSADAESAARELALWFPPEARAERVYMVASERYYGEGLRGVFPSLADAAAFVRERDANYDYVIVSYVLGEPETEQHEERL